MRTLRGVHLGFTLIELMVTMALVAILAALAGPSIELLARRVRLDSDTERFQSALSYARSEAIKRSTTVSVVPSGSGFTGGWQVFTDDGTQNPDCTLTAAQGETLLRVQDPLSVSTNFLIAASPATEATSIACTTAQPGPPACISYQRDGGAIRTDGSFLASTFCLRDQSNPTGMFRAVVINSTGQAYLSKVRN
jgi:prepilin-type N-terminal cleavage/methylation domain-containing protein